MVMNTKNLKYYKASKKFLETQKQNYNVYNPTRETNQTMFKSTGISANQEISHYPQKCGYYFPSIVSMSSMMK